MLSIMLNAFILSHCQSSGDGLSKEQWQNLQVKYFFVFSDTLLSSNGHWQKDKSGPTSWRNTVLTKSTISTI